MTCKTKQKGRKKKITIKAVCGQKQDAEDERERTKEQTDLEPVILSIKPEHVFALLEEVDLHVTQRLL